jgi:nucleoside 2-deoxyribosyltransferase
MKIYFCGSISGGRDLAATYEKMIGMLGSYGRVLTEHLGSDEAIESNDRVMTDKEIHDRDMHWIVESDLLVAEVTVPSLGVGYEIGRALEMGKPILTLFRPGGEYRLSSMVAGSDKVEVKHYNNLEEVKDLFEAFFNALAPHRTN